MPGQPDLGDRLDRIEDTLAQILREMRARKRRGAKRAGTVAQRAAADVTSQPTELQRALARRALQKASGG